MYFLYLIIEKSIFKVWDHIKRSSFNMCINCIQYIKCINHINPIEQIKHMIKYNIRNSLLKGDKNLIVYRKEVKRIKRKVRRSIKIIEMIEAEVEATKNKPNNKKPKKRLNPKNKKINITLHAQLNVLKTNLTTEQPPGFLKPNLQNTHFFSKINAI